MNTTSKTDWKRLSQMDDKAIDTSDIPELDDEFLKQAKITVPPKQPVTLRLDADVLGWFKSQGQGIKHESISCYAVIWKPSSIVEGLCLWETVATPAVTTLAKKASKVSASLPLC